MFSLIWFDLFSCPSLCRVFNVSADRRSPSRPNNLDRCRKEFIKKNLVSLLSPASVYPSLCLTVLLSVFLTSCPSTLQIILARQAVRLRRRITRRIVKQRLTDSRKLLRKLRLLAKEVRGHKVVFIGHRIAG